MRTDRYGELLTTESDAAAAAFDRAVDDYVAFRDKPGEHVKAALAADPDFAMAHCLRGYFYLMLGVPAVTPKARQCAATAKGGVATPREHEHFLALDHWCDGNLTGALARWEQILIDHPTDMLALRLAHALHFDLGDGRNLRDSIARVFPAWAPDNPGHGHVAGMYAFGLEECGEYQRAEALGRAAVERDPEDIWAVHAVAHVMEMQGRRADGIAWLEGLAPSWTKCNFFVHHVWWHLALYHLERDEHEAALAVYDRRVRDDFSEIVLDMLDAASLLWRLELRGVDVGARWEELADKSETHVNDHIDAFSDVHFMMCFAASGRDGAAEDLIESMQAYAATRPVTMAPIIREVGIPVCQALAAYRAGDHEHAIALLAPLRYHVMRIGGSHAQRDLFDQTLIAATLKARRFNLARALLAERTAQRPTSAPSWRAYAAALDGAGDGSGAEAARATAAALLAT